MCCISKSIIRASAVTQLCLKWTEPERCTALKGVFTSFSWGAHLCSRAQTQLGGVGRCFLIETKKQLLLWLWSILSSPLWTGFPSGQIRTEPAQPVPTLTVSHQPGSRFHMCQDESFRAVCPIPVVQQPCGIGLCGWGEGGGEGMGEGRAVGRAWLREHGWCTEWHPQQMCSCQAASVGFC